MKRIFWLSQLIFTGTGLVFFISLHLLSLVQLVFPSDLFLEGFIFFALGLVPMWIVVVLSIYFGKWKNRKNWLQEMIAAFPQPERTKRIAMVLWAYMCLFALVAIIVPNSVGQDWASYLRSIGMPCFFMGFYSIGFLCAWANWKKCNSTP